MISGVGRVPVDLILSLQASYNRVSADMWRQRSENDRPVNCRSSHSNSARNGFPTRAHLACSIQPARHGLLDWGLSGLGRLASNPKGKSSDGKLLGFFLVQVLIINWIKHIKYLICHKSATNPCLKAYLNTAMISPASAIPNFSFTDSGTLWKFSNCVSRKSMICDSSIPLFREANSPRKQFQTSYSLAKAIGRE